MHKTILKGTAMYPTKISEVNQIVKVFISNYVYAEYIWI